MSNDQRLARSPDLHRLPSRHKISGVALFRLPHLADRPQLVVRSSLGRVVENGGSVTPFGIVMPLQAVGGAGKAHPMSG